MNLSNKFLIASPALDNTSFERAVVYVCQHDHTGTMGLVINHVTREPVLELFKQFDIQYQGQEAQKQQYLYAGGPVRPESGFIIHSPIGSWDSSYAVGESLAITTSQDILAAVAEDKGPDQWLITLGHVGWEAEQLEGEIKSGDWLIAETNDDFIFNTPVNKRWQTALASIGVVNPLALSTFSGRA